MKVIENTSDQLVIEDRPWFLWITLPILGGPALVSALTGQFDGWATTMLVAALGIGMFWILWRFAPFQRMIFDRTTNTFIHHVHRLTGRRTWDMPLTEIRRATEERDPSDSSRLERVTLLTNSGRYPLESGFTSQPRTPVIQAINTWLGV